MVLNSTSRMAALAGSSETARRAVAELSDWHASGQFWVERRSSVTERVFTTFDHAVIAVRLFELIGDPTYLSKSAQALAERAHRQRGGHVWRFSDWVPDIPPDADSTVNALLLFHHLKAAGVDSPAEIVLADAAVPFGGLVGSAGGMYTYFGAKRANDVDPAINLCVAELLIRVGGSHELLSRVGAYLNAFLIEYSWESPASRYYLGPAYLSERAARVAALAPGFLDPRPLARLDGYLKSTLPEGPLATAMCSLACGGRGLLDRQASLNELLCGLLDPADGWWDFDPFYIQRTPRYEYGSRLLTTVFALSALTFSGHSERGAPR